MMDTIIRERHRAEKNAMTMRDFSIAAITREAIYDFIEKENQNLNSQHLQNQFDWFNKMLISYAEYK